MAWPDFSSTKLCLLSETRTHSISPASGLHAGSNAEHEPEKQPNQHCSIPIGVAALVKASLVAIELIRFMIILLPRSNTTDDTWIVKN